MNNKLNQMIIICRGSPFAEREILELSDITRRQAWDRAKSNISKNVPSNMYSKHTRVSRSQPHESTDYGYVGPCIPFHSYHLFRLVRFWKGGKRGCLLTNNRDLASCRVYFRRHVQSCPALNPYIVCTAPWTGFEEPKRSAQSLFSICPLVIMASMKKSMKSAAQDEFQRNLAHYFEMYCHFTREKVCWRMLDILLLSGISVFDIEYKAGLPSLIVLGSG